MENEAKKNAPLEATRESKNKKNLQEYYTSKEGINQFLKGRGITKGTKDDRYYNWASIGWSESLVGNWREILEAIAKEMDVRIAVSPIHKEDTYEDGTLKKPHYHFIFSFIRPKSILKVMKITNLIKSMCPKKIGAYYGAVFKDMWDATRYLTHADHPFVKKTYEPREIASINGYEVERYFKRDNDVVKKKAVEQTKDIKKIVREFGLTNRADISDVIENSTPYLYETFMYKYGFLKDYIEQNELRINRRNNQNGLQQ